MDTSTSQGCVCVLGNCIPEGLFSPEWPPVYSLVAVQIGGLLLHSAYYIRTLPGVSFNYTLPATPSQELIILETLSIKIKSIACKSLAGRYLLWELFLL